MDKPVKVKDAPGLVWKKRGYGFEARWQARSDLIARGFLPKSERLWGQPGEPTADEWNWIADRSRMLQSEMLVWARGGLPQVSHFDGTIKSLIDRYQTDPDSTYHKMRYGVRVNSDHLTRRIAEAHGDEYLRELRARTFLRWYEAWSDGGKFAMGHSFMTKLRTLFSFGKTILEDEECARLSAVLHDMKFKGAKVRTERITPAQADAVRVMAYRFGFRSVALAQAFQFECTLRQKDVIGEWVPISENIPSDVHDGKWKWVRGLRWNEIDKNLVLRHVTSKKEKPVVINLTKAPMVMEELKRQFQNGIPTDGPIIVAEHTGKPWAEGMFRRRWRESAVAAGVPKEVWNMDSRSGAITEALLAGANPDSVRKAATHSNLSTTLGYSRGDEQAIEDVQDIRTRSRNKGGTK